LEEYVMQKAWGRGSRGTAFTWEALGLEFKVQIPELPEMKRWTEEEGEEGRREGREGGNKGRKEGEWEGRKEGRKERRKGGRGREGGRKRGDI
jgi:hypothetical protein